MLKNLVRRPAVQSFVAWLLGQYLKFALGTMRWTLAGEANLLAFAAARRPAVVAFWHERLPLMPALVRMGRRHWPQARIHVLVSRHHDGRFIGKIMGCFDMRMVHGSTERAGERPGQRGGAAGVRAMLAVLAEGAYVGITPDGPRGPRRRASPGVAQLAALSGEPVLPCAAQVSHRRLLGTWDRMVLPLPFGRGVVAVGAPIAVPREGWEAFLPRIEAALTEAADTADRLCQ